MYLGTDKTGHPAQPIAKQNVPDARTGFSQRIPLPLLKTVVTAIGAGVAVWGVINLLEGYGNDNPGANAHVR